MPLKKYKKKELVVEAEQYIEHGKLVKGMCNSISCFSAGNTNPHVHTANDNQMVNLKVGDFIIAELDGRHYYPCNPDTFKVTYEEVV